MKRRILRIFIICVTMSHLGSSISTAADVKVMYAIGLLDYGENARLVTTEEFNQTVANYEKFRDRVAKAPTLKAMVQNGWTIVHVEQIRAGDGDPYRELNYLIIFQGGRR
ncbi:MAG TPA: hypothetical protein VMU21_07270 [Thermodesulfovibrionales bacterium]|nr:hypothetical protein [Thermodesulfovibrionales bacterium]